MNVATPVLVLSTGNLGHGIARTLGRLGVRAYVVHTTANLPAARSRYWAQTFVWPLATAPAAESVEWLIELGTRIGSRPIIIPADDIVCLLVADHADALRDTFQFPSQPAGLARSLSNKREMYSLCERHSIPTPATAFPQTRADVVAFAETATFPVMLKPIENGMAQRRSEMRMVKVEDARALVRRYDEMETAGCPNYMIQEYIPGGPDMVWMFDGYFDEGSRCLFGMTGKKLRQYPAYTGVTSLGICIANETVSRQTIELMAALGYRGALDLGYKYDVRNGQYRLLDVNPRVGSTFRLFVDSVGMDVVRALYLDLTGQPVITGEMVEGRKWIVENFDVLSSVRYMRDGRLGFAEWFRSFSGVAEGSWLATDDLAPFAAMVRYAASKGLAQFRSDG
jgi:predicted ATP-grasp superfamily ATP-dependent carboligase